MQQGTTHKTTTRWPNENVPAPRGPSAGSLNIETRPFTSPDDARRALKDAAPGLRADWTDELARRLVVVADTPEVRPGWLSVRGEWYDGWLLACRDGGRSETYFVSDNSGTVTGRRPRSATKILTAVAACMALFVAVAAIAAWRSSVEKAALAAERAAEAARVQQEQEQIRQGLLSAVPGVVREIDATVTASTALDSTRLEAERKELARAEAMLVKFSPLGLPLPAELATAAERLKAAVALNERRSRLVDLFKQAHAAAQDGDDSRSARRFLAADDAYERSVGLLSLDDQEASLLKLDVSKLRAEVKRKQKAIANEVAAERARVQKEEEARLTQVAYEQLCGPKPTRSGWDGEVIGIASALKESAHDPSSIDVEDCTDPVMSKKNCWITACKVRGKNAFGARILAVKKFAISKALGVQEFD